jgi:hypothetical protein
MFQDSLNGLLYFTETHASESHAVKGGKQSEIESKVYENR